MRVSDGLGCHEEGKGRESALSAITALSLGLDTAKTIKTSSDC